MPSQASQYRLLLWLFTVTGLFCFYPAIQGARGVLPAGMGLAAGVVGVVCLFTGAWFGWRGVVVRQEERRRKSEAVGLVMLAAAIKEKPTAELEALALQDGPVAEAAALVLARRAEEAGRRSGG
jgi:hypothetical protein